ncbi:hypothetical protein STEG23_013968, partial [Scotinomys teguina]
MLCSIALTSMKETGLTGHEGIKVWVALSEADVCKIVYVPQENTKALLQRLDQLLDFSAALYQGWGEKASEQSFTFGFQALQALCNQGAPTEASAQSHLAEIHSDSVILRDDFDSYHQQELNPNIWAECSNCETGEQCGTVMHGKAVTFCEPYGPRELTTTCLNTTTASVLQFSI